MEWGGTEEDTLVNSRFTCVSMSVCSFWLPPTPYKFTVYDFIPLYSVLCLVCSSPGVLLVASFTLLQAGIWASSWLNEDFPLTFRATLCSVHRKGSLQTSAFPWNTPPLLPIRKAFPQICGRSSPKSYFFLQKNVYTKWWKNKSAEKQNTFPFLFLFHGKGITQTCPSERLFLMEASFLYVWFLAPALWLFNYNLPKQKSGANFLSQYSYMFCHCCSFEKLDEVRRKPCWAVKLLFCFILPVLLKNMELMLSSA